MRVPWPRTLRCRSWMRYVIFVLVALVVIVNIIALYSFSLKVSMFKYYMQNMSSSGTTYTMHSSSFQLLFNTSNLNNTHIREDQLRDIPNATSSDLASLTESSDEFQKTHFMTVNGNGRLGNQMFQFAALIGVSAMHGYAPFIPLNNKLKPVFDIACARSVVMTNTKGHGEVRAGAYDTRIENLSHNTNWTLHGYFQSWKYFRHVAHDVRKAFRFQHDIYQKAATKLRTLGANIFVGVHIRRGDMNSKRELSRGYNVADESFIYKAIDYFRKKFKDPIFVVIADDISWTRSKIRGDDIKIAASGSAGVDLALMAQCNHSIITSGTYGWWGAFLAGGGTVYFKNYPRPGSWLEKQYVRGDYYPPDWIGMS